MITEPVQEFDMETVYTNVDGEKISHKDMDAAVMGLTKLLEWVWQSGPKNMKGIEIRAIVVCWIFLKHLRPLTLKRMSELSNRDKQSLGRWVEDWKHTFPHIKTEHMRNL